MYTVLVVEDEPEVLKLLRSTFEKQGFRVIPAPNAAEALERFGKEPIDVVITDVIMPGLDGANMLRRMREVRSDLKALFITGFTDHIVASVIGDLPYEVVRKPFRCADLVQKVKSLIGFNFGSAGPAGV